MAQEAGDGLHTQAVVGFAVEQEWSKPMPWVGTCKEWQRMNVTKQRKTHLESVRDRRAQDQDHSMTFVSFQQHAPSRTHWDPVAIQVHRTVASAE